MLVQVLMALALQLPVTAASDFEVAGAHIGMSYTDLREKFPGMVCEVSCVDPTAMLHGMSGNLWAGIGNSAVNQLAFRFKPTLNEQQSETIRKKYIELYGQASRVDTDSACEEWDRRNGSIVLCIENGLSFTYWKDDFWGTTTSDIPDDV